MSAVQPYAFASLSSYSACSRRGSGPFHLRPRGLTYQAVAAIHTPALMGSA